MRSLFVIYHLSTPIQKKPILYIAKKEKICYTNINRAVF